jgi:hypothetical protein
MTSNTQVKFNALRNIGHTGSQEDMELQFYLANGATTNSLRDAEMQFLETRGYSLGAVDDRWSTFLRAEGYTGSKDDMLYAWWVYVGIALNFNLLLETGDDLLLETNGFLLQEY